VQHLLQKKKMTLTALFAKIKARDPTVFPAWEVLRMATIEGAQAVELKTRLPKSGLDDREHLGDRIEDDLVPNLVYTGSGHEVKAAMVAGRVLMRDRQVLTVDEAAIRAEAQAQAEAVARRVAADPVHRGMALLKAMEARQL
jgi:5-methylthioadenosine/S-adenosylhomocysteine deaminase